MNNNNAPLHLAGVSLSFKDALSKRAVWLPVLLVFCLLLPTLNSGLLRDDYLHRTLLLGLESFPGSQEEAFGPVDAANKLFSFFYDGNDLLENAKAYGNIPWWTDPELKVSFWRPLAAITHWLDYQLWPDSPALMHLHSTFWYLLVGMLLGVWLIKLGVSNLALWLAMLLYVFDASHVHAVGWLANRNILIATCFGLLSMICLTHWSVNRSSLQLVAALSFYLATLLSAEAGISTLGLVIPFLLVIDKNTVAQKLMAFIGFVLVTAAWRIVYSELGYGAIHSGFYVDPINDTPNFIHTLLINGPIMLYEQLIRVPSLSMLMSPAVEINQAVISFVVLIITALLFLPMLIKNKLALYGLLVAIIAVPPACATIVSGGRLMFFFGIGVTLTCAIWFAGLKQNEEWFQKGKLYRGFAYLWSGLIVIAISAGTGFVWYSKVASAFGPEKPPFNIHSNIVEDVSEDQVVVIVNPPVLFEQMYMPLKADYFGLAKPEQMISIVPGLTPISLKQEGQKLILENPQGFLIAGDADWPAAGLPQNSLAFLAKRADRFFVSNHKQIDYQKRYNLRDIVLTVVATTENGDPSKVEVEFPQSLNSEKYVVLWWDWEAKVYKDLSELSNPIIKGPF